MTPKVCALASRATPSEDCTGLILKCKDCIGIKLAVPEGNLHACPRTLISACHSPRAPVAEHRVAKIAVNTVLLSGADADTSPVRNPIAGMRHGDQLSAIWT